MSKPTVIFVCGPTASGKTAWAIRIAQHLNTVILSADSRQCYRELNIGVARPSEEELNAVPHHFIASHSITDELNAAWYEEYALKIASDVFANHPYLVVVGGTGLYIKAFRDGMDNIPPVDPAIRERIRQTYAQSGMEWLKEAVKQADPLYFETGETENPQRMMRALEVAETTGKSIRSFQTSQTSLRSFNSISIAPDWPREALYERINRRVDMMVEAGLEEEARSLLPQKHLNALQTVGYSEFFDYFDGKISRTEAIEKIKQHTRQYAKRQLTWFKRDSSVSWINPLQGEQITDIVDMYIKQLQNPR